MYPLRVLLKDYLIKQDLHYLRQIAEETLQERDEQEQILQQLKELKSVWETCKKNKSENESIRKQGLD